jgi:hypothetical protein
MNANNNNINVNIKPCWWGAHVWQTVYFMVATYPNNPTQLQIESMCNFFKALRHLLPCQTCQESYKKFSCESTTNAEYMDNFKSRDKLIVFVYNLRNKVNSKLTNEYYIDLNYFKKKLEHMVMSDNNIYDGKVCEMAEAPFVHKELEKKIFNYLKTNTNYDPIQASKILDFLKQFMKNPVFDYNDRGFKFTYKRNRKCRKLINKIYHKMSEGDYDLVQSFLVHDRKLHESLLFLGCSILHKENLEHVLDSKVSSKK